MVFNGNARRMRYIQRPNHWEFVQEIISLQAYDEAGFWDYFSAPEGPRGRPRHDNDRGDHDDRGFEPRHGVGMVDWVIYRDLRGWLHVCPPRLRFDGRDPRGFGFQHGSEPPGWVRGRDGDNRGQSHQPDGFNVGARRDRQVFQNGRLPFIPRHERNQGNVYGQRARADLNAEYLRWCVKNGWEPGYGRSLVWSYPDYENDRRGPADDFEDGPARSRGSGHFWFPGP